MIGDLGHLLTVGEVVGLEFSVLNRFFSLITNLKRFFRQKVALDEPLKVDVPQPFGSLFEELLIGEIIQYLDLIVNIGVPTNKSTVQKLGQSTVWLLVERIEENLELLVLDVLEILCAGLEFL